MEPRESKYINVLAETDAFIFFSDENLKKFYEDISKGCKFSITKLQRGNINVVQIPGAIDIRYYDEHGVRHYIMSNDCRRQFLRSQKLINELLNM